MTKKIGEIGLQEVAQMMREGTLTLKIFSFDDEVEGRLLKPDGEEFGVIDTELLEKLIESLLPKPEEAPISSNFNYDGFRRSIRGE